MTNKADESEKLESYAVDVRNLREVHERIVAKRNEIEAMLAEEQHLDPLETLADSERVNLKNHIAQLFEQWEKERGEDGQVTTGSEAFRKLAQELFDLEQQVLDAQDEQVEEATHHPFAHPLR